MQQERNKSVVIKKGCHFQKFLLGISHIRFRKWAKLFKQAEDPRQNPSGMTPLFNNSAFTLIELLVVVLIIGILAAVAVPQYQKAVEKSRIAEAKLVLNTVRKNYQLCVLEYGNQDECTDYDLFISNHLTIDIGAWTTESCSGIGGTQCVRTKDWAYQTDDPEAFAAVRMIGDTEPYYLYIDYMDGSITCNDYESTTYCKMLCGADECTL